MVCRIRNIKPSFFEDEIIAGLDPIVRLFYIGLWTRCDLRGVFEWQPKVLAALFPFDEKVTGETVTSWLEELKKLKRVRSYIAEKRQYGQVMAFVEHQIISTREKERGPQYPVIMAKAGTCRTHVENVPGTPDLGHGTYDFGHRTRDDQKPEEKKPKPPIVMASFREARRGEKKPTAEEEIRIATLRAIAIKDRP